ncbi:hypothetical protein AB0O39_00500 [Streptomyces anulatus]|uniref:hypothetical protein n=1 Tax=Streptomyces anulatus TaxID=1892 RepID=UPI00342E7417
MPILTGSAHSDVPARDEMPGRRSGGQAKLVAVPDHINCSYRRCRLIKLPPQLSPIATLLILYKSAFTLPSQSPVQPLQGVVEITNDERGLARFA